MDLKFIPQPKEITYQNGSISNNTSMKEIINPNLNHEEYLVSVKPEEILLQGGSPQALVYARRTWEQMVFQCGDKVPLAEIHDEPEFSYRAFHIDCARHFFSLEELKKMIDMASYFKLNYFHWHFSDDQGWRIESKVFPKLHEVGSRRKGDHFGRFCSDHEEGGYYTRQEVKELTAFCEERGIEIVPEIDLPGHVVAILASYPELQLNCTGETQEVGTKAGVYDEIFCAGKEEVFQFVETLFDDMLELFPGKYFHIGGDEAPKVRWRECPHCARRMEEEGLHTFQELQGYLVNRIAAYLQEKGKKVIAWNEAAYGKNLNQDIAIQFWIDDKDDAVKYHVQHGGSLIVSNVMNSYCDYPYGSISLENVYALNTDPDEMRAGSVLGTECLLWTEFIRENEHLESLAWPRFAASAEVGWCGEKRPGYASFCGRLQELFPVFVAHGICATEEAGWVPDEKTGAEQIAEFESNFSKEDMIASERAKENI